MVLNSVIAYSPFLSVPHKLRESETESIFYIYEIYGEIKISDALDGSLVWIC